MVLAQVLVCTCAEDIARAAAPDPAGERIAVFGAEGTAMSQQLEAELRLLGFEVVHAPAPAVADPHALRKLARELDVSAAILIDARAAELDLWVVDRVTGKTLLRSVSVGSPDSPDSARIAAVRAIDLLRASFRELKDSPSPPRAEVAPSPPVEAAARGTPPRFGLAIGPSVAGSVGGVGATPHVTAWFIYRPRRVVGVGVRGFVPIVGARVRAPEGTARLHIGWLTVGPRVFATNPYAVVHASFGANVGPVFVGMRGEAGQPFRGRQDLVISALTEVDAAVGFRVHPRLRLAVDASIGVAVPRVGVRFAGRREAMWGWPVGAGAVAVEVAL